MWASTSPLRYDPRGELRDSVPLARRRWELATSGRLIRECGRHAFESDVHHLPGESCMEGFAGAAHGDGHPQHLLAEPPGGAGADLVVAVCVRANGHGARGVTGQLERHDPPAVACLVGDRGVWDGCRGVRTGG